MRLRGSSDWVRSTGTRASVTITFTGTDNTVIPEGTWVVADTGERYRTIFRRHDLWGYRQCGGRSRAGGT